MPWWIWLILALFMLAMIVAGLHLCSPSWNPCLERHVRHRRPARWNAWPRWGNLAPLPTPASRLCSLQPLSVAQNRYAEAHAGRDSQQPPSANATPRHGPAGSDSTTNGKQQWHVTNTIRAMPIPRR